MKPVLNKSIKMWIMACLLLAAGATYANRIVIEMDAAQTNHMKAYGLAYWILAGGQEMDWLLNYKGGSFACSYSSEVEKECIIRGVSYKVISESQYAAITESIFSPEANMDVMKLEKPPKVAVYSPKSKLPWDDAVTLVLTYAEIPYDVIFDEEIMTDMLPKYDWLHLHHEDFTGQYGKFYANYRTQAWYRQQQLDFEESARRHGFTKVSQLKLEITKRIKAFVASGGFLFAMCSATDTYDIALAAEGVDICESMFDGDPADGNAQSKLNFNNTVAFHNFRVEMNPFVYEYGNIDSRPNNEPARAREENDYFNLFEFSAKWDPVPTMLTQNHTRLIKAFMGQTTAFDNKLIKSDVLIMADNKELGEARYIHGELGKGTWTFYGGHDPEDYQHFVHDPPTDLNLHPNSPGYRLILNNILFPAAKKKKRKT